MSVLSGDFIGFTYNGVHSSDLGIVRTSDGSRFKENLLPTMKDKTAEREGADGMLYWGSQYTSKKIPISFAFDSLTQEQLERLKFLFGDRGVHELILDEIPYKVYKAKITSSATISYICFDEGATGRLYKGEGNIEFTAFTPFARSRFKFLEEYSEEEYTNTEEWAIASRMKEVKDNYDKLIGNEIKVYNAGDLETNFKVSLWFEEGTGVTNCLGLFFNEQGLQLLFENDIQKKGEDLFVKIDSALNLIEGFKLKQNTENEYVKSGNIYNEYLTGGDFFRLPRGEGTLVLNKALSDIELNAEIEYDYLYY